MRIKSIVYNFENRNHNKDITKNIALFGTLTVGNISRIPQHYELYSKKINQIPGFSSVYINYHNTNTSFNISSEIPPNIVTNEYYKKLKNTNPRLRFRYKDIDLLVKDYFLLSYFYYETNYRWVYRGADDAAINVNLIKKYFDNLEKKYNPLTDKVILGNCVGTSRMFLQGGSGYIFSRKAVELMLPHFKEVIRSCNYPEDVLHNKFLNYLKLNLNEASSEHMIGHSFYDSDLKRIYKNDFSHLPKCPNIINTNTSTCKKFHSPVNQLLFLHQLGSNANVINNISNVLFNLKNDNVHWYMCTIYTPCLCEA